MNLQYFQLMIPGAQNGLKEYPPSVLVEVKGERLDDREVGARSFIFIFVYWFAAHLVICSSNFLVHRVGNNWKYSGTVNVIVHLKLRSRRCSSVVSTRSRMWFWARWIDEARCPGTRYTSRTSEHGRVTVVPMGEGYGRQITVVSISIIQWIPSGMLRTLPLALIDEFEGENGGTGWW